MCAVVCVVLFLCVVCCFFVCVHVVSCVVVWCCVYMWCCVLCGVVCGVGVVCVVWVVSVCACGVVVHVVWCGVVCGEAWHAENPLCVRSKRLRVYGQDVSVCTGNKPACVRHAGLLPVHTETS